MALLNSGSSGHMWSLPYPRSTDTFWLPSTDTIATEPVIAYNVDSGSRQLTDLLSCEQQINGVGQSSSGIASFPATLDGKCILHLINY